MIDDLGRLALGLASGVIFGILLQKGQVAKHEKIVGQLMLRDWTVAKVMATAIAVGTLGVHALLLSESATLHVQSAALARLIVGGALFGGGMALLGLCPGTTVAACGEGRRDAMAGVLGMFAGAWLYVSAFGALAAGLTWLPDLGKVTIPQLAGTPAWPWALGLAGVTAAALRLARQGGR